MAETLINAGIPIRFEAGGQIEITNEAGTTYDVVLIEAGTLQIEPGGYEPIIYHNRDALQVPLRGQERLTRIAFTAQLTSFAASQLIQILAEIKSTSSEMALFTFVVKYANYKGATAGQTVTVAKCFVQTPARVRAGVQLDTVEVEMMSITAVPTMGTY